MDRPDYVKLFATPDDYKPPDDLRNDTQYPNLNSKQYRLKPIDRIPKLLPFFECLAQNEYGNILLGCNELRGRLWDGYIWGFENFNEFGDEKKASFKINTKSNCTNLKYLNYNIFVVSQTSGSIQIWSTKSDNRDVNSYCLYKIGETFEHDGIIYGLDVFPQDSNKIVSGCSEGTLKVWDAGKADLFSTNTYRFAHTRTITSLSCDSKDYLFASCSKDHSALLWDYRLPLPATGLFDSHTFGFTWIQLNQSGQDTSQDLVYLGDETGYLHVIDRRKPQKFLVSFKVFDRPLRKAIITSDTLAVLGETNIIKVLKYSDENFEIIYENNESDNFIRDGLWNTNRELMTIGWDSKLRKHII